MKKWTFLGLHVDHKNKTYFLQNFGWTEDDVIKNLKLTPEETEIFRKSYFNGFEKDISDNELYELLNYVFTNLDILGVYDIENRFNNDQKVINKMKDNERLIWDNKGYTETNHCPSVEIDYKRKKRIINERDYLYILQENIRKSEKKFEELEKEYDIFEDEFKKYKLDIEFEKQEINKSLITYESDRKEKLNKELELLQYEVKENTEKIKRQNWYLEKTKEYEQQYNYWKEKFDNIVERYKKGLKKCEEQENNAKENWPDYLKKLETDIKEKEEELKVLTEQRNEITNNINELQPQLKYIENRISSYESELDSILNKYI